MSRSSCGTNADLTIGVIGIEQAMLRLSDSNF